MTSAGVPGSRTYQAERALGITGRGGGIVLNRPSFWRISRQPSSWTIR
ncbi:MAG: hypothetical protein M3Z28_09360 [Candidatus Dormibacteraeota bacterium]|nr:hypothetical protein [Candidatus Dormibacteraeota bacterium]